MLLDGPEQIKLGERHMQAWGELSLNQGRGQDVRIRKVLQEIAAQVCTDVYNRSRIIVVFYKVDECNV
jgi:hypothetical protein